MMKNGILSGFVTLVVAGLLAFSCNTPDTELVDSKSLTGPLTITFDNVAGTSDLALNTGTYKNAAGESFSVSKFNYFISNLRLRRDDGTDFVVPQDSSYFLIEEERPTSQTLTVRNIPAGNYTGLTFLIGVDSLRSLSDISKRTGVLDPGLTTHDPMYWEWNSGYIFVKLEGTSAAAPAAQNNGFMYHIGGFGGGYNGKKTINNLRTVTLPFNGDRVAIAPTARPTLRLKTDVLNVLSGSTAVSIAQNPSVMFEPFSSNIANNYVQMVSYDRLQTN